MVVSAFVLQTVKESVSIEDWVDVWGETVGRARKLADLPMWLQCYPKVEVSKTLKAKRGLFLL